MDNTKHSRSAGRSGERGAALVEFAVIMPLLVMLVLGLFSGGLAYNKQLAVTNGVREGSRYGATLSLTSASTACAGAPLDCWLARIATITEVSSEGHLDASVAQRRICVAYVYPEGTAATGGATRRLVRTASGDLLSSGTCFADGRPTTERRVQVQGSRDARLEWLLGASDLTLSSRSVTRFEAAL